MSRLDPLAACLRSLGGVLVIALGLGACASTSPYLGEGRPNMVIRTDTGEWTLRSATNAWVEVQRVVVPG